MDLEKKKLLPRSVKPKGGGTLASDKALKCQAKATEEHQGQQGQAALCPREAVACILAPVRGGLVACQQKLITGSQSHLGTKDKCLHTKSMLGHRDENTRE